MKKDKIKYKAISLRELLIEMKDTVELMLDLAYSTILFMNNDIALEIHELEDKIHTLTYLVGMNTMLAARDAADAERLEPLIRIAYSVDRIADAAADIAGIILHKMGLHPALLEALRSSNEQIIRSMIVDKALHNKTIGKMNIRGRTGSQIIAIRRGGKWIFDPTKNTKLKLDDILIARGSGDGNQLLCQITGGQCSYSIDVGEKEKSFDTLDDFQEIEQGLLDLKNTSESMVGLALSAILFHSKEIAEDVIEMEEKIDEMHVNLERKVLSLAKIVPNPEKLLGILRFTISSEEISDAAAQIVEIILRGQEPHPVFDAIILESDDIISRVQVLKNSQLAHNTVRDSKIQVKTGMKIIAIKRDNDFLYKISADTTILPNDILIAEGPDEGKALLEKLARVN